MSKYKWIFTKLGVCIDIVAVWFEIANGQISSIFELSARDMSIFSFSGGNFSKCQWIFTKLGMCIVIVESCFGIAYVKFHQFLTELSACDTFVIYP